MSKHNRKPSQHPAHQQVSTRPASPGEAPLDTLRVPSPATDSQSEQDALASDQDRYQAGEGVTVTDPLPGEATDVGADGEEEFSEAEDLVGEDEEDEDGEGEEEDFAGFEDISERPRRHVNQPQPTNVRAAETLPTVINRSLAEQEAYDSELVPILPRATQQRVNIGGEWYNFIKGQEQFVPRAVADHLRSKGVV